MSKAKITREVSFDVEADSNGVEIDAPVSTQGARRSFDKAKRLLQAEFEQAMKAEMAKAEARIRAQSGTKYVGLTLLSSAKALIESPGSAAVYSAIIEHIFTPTGASETQTGIREVIAARFPLNAVTKDWTKPLPKWALKKVATRIQTSAPPFNALRVASGLTLASLHRQAAKAVEKHQGGIATYRAAIGISDETVYVNDVPFTISANASGGKTYRQVRINVAKLVAALQR